MHMCNNNVAARYGHGSSHKQIRFSMYHDSYVWGMVLRMPHVKDKHVRKLS